MIQTTSSCNAACTFCPHPDTKDEVSQGTMETALFDRVIDELSHHDSVIRILMYLMNEPLLDPRLPERIDQAKERNPQATVHIVTNGVLLGKMGDRLLKSKLDWMGLSVHALKDETYLKLMGLKNFEGEKGIKQIIEKFCRKAVEEKGPEYVDLKIIRDSRYLDQEEGKAAIQHWRDVGLSRVEYFEAPISRAGNVDWIPQVHRPAIQGCTSIWAMEMVHVLWNGDVLPCCNDWRRKVILGNVKEQSIEEIWNGPARLQFLREVYGETAPRPGLICLNCEMAEPSNKVWPAKARDETSNSPQIETNASEVAVSSSTAIRSTPQEVPVSHNNDESCCSSAASGDNEAVSECCSQESADAVPGLVSGALAAFCCGPAPSSAGCSDEASSQPSEVSPPPEPAIEVVAGSKSKPRRAKLRATSKKAKTRKKGDILRGHHAASKRISAPTAEDAGDLEVDLPEPKPVTPCPFPALPPEQREAHHLVALEGGEPDLLLVALPPGSSRGPATSLLHLTSRLLSRKVRAFAYDYNLAAYNKASTTSKKKWSEYADADYNLPETSMPVLRSWMSYGPKAAQEIQGLAPKAVALHVSAAALRAATDLTARLVQAGFTGPIYWYGPAVRPGMEKQLPPGGIPTAFLVGDAEKSLPLLLAGSAQPAGVALPETQTFKPTTPFQDTRYLEIGDVTPFHFGGYESPQVELGFGRGCTERCPHCPRGPHNLLLRQRTAEDLYLEMARLHEEKGISDFVLGETQANTKPEELLKVAAMIRKSRLPLTWEARYLPAENESRNHYRQLHDGGCRRLRFCIPTGPGGYQLDERLALGLRLSFWASIQTSIDTLPVGLPSPEGQTDSDAGFQALTKFLWEQAEYIDDIETLSDLLLLNGTAYDRNMAAFGITRLGNDLARDWHDNHYLNKEFRRKRLKEIHVFLEDKKIRLPSRERIFGMGGQLLEQEPRVRERINRRSSRPVDAVLATTPVWGYTDPPVALGYLSSYLRSHGYKCEVHDYNTQLYLNSPQEMKLMWHVENKNYWSSRDTFPFLQAYYHDQLEKWADEIAESPAKVVGFSVVDPKERMTISLIRRIKMRDPSKHIILGGPAAYTPDFRAIFVHQAHELIDGFVVGEGEATLADIIEAIKAGKEIHGIPGVVTYPDGEHPHETFRSPIAPLDSVPFPDYKDFDMAKYPSKQLILEWSRGCVNRCAFCKGVAITGKWRNRSPAHIVEELKYHVRRNGIQDFEISDQLINGDVPQLMEICDRIIEAKLDIRWMCQGLPQSQMTQPVFEKLKAAGCFDFKFGLESASDKVIRMMGKGSSFTRAEAQQVIRNAHAAGIETSLFCIIGYPGEGEKEFMETYDFYKDNAEYITRIKSINALAIITDTPIHKHAAQFDVVLPEFNYHYLWHTKDGSNTLEIRRDRIRRLLALAKDEGLQVMETNLTEGKQDELTEKMISDKKSLREGIELMQAQTNRLGSFDTKKREEESQREREVLVLDNMLPPRLPAAAADQEGAGQLPAEVTDPFDLEILGIMNGKSAFKGPEILEIDMTNDCNLSCAGCWCHSDMMGDRRFAGAFKHHHLPLDVVRQLVDDAAAMGTKRVQLAGSGEPFRHPDIFPIIRHIKSKGLEVKIITNLTLVDEAGIREMVELGVEELTISVWAGTPEAYERTHPGTGGKTFHYLEDMLLLLQRSKGLRLKPFVKLYNVISNRNHDDIENMVNFALRVGAQSCEFTPVDTIEGYTDSLRLSEEQSQDVLAAFERVKTRVDYPWDLGTEHLQSLDQEKLAEFTEFPGRIMTDPIYPGFEFYNGRRGEPMSKCPVGEEAAYVYPIPELSTGSVFLWDKHRCQACPQHDTCSINKDKYAVKREFMSILGYGGFARRIQGDVEQGKYEKNFINTMPCYIGWIYSRVTTDGNVIPCCKGYGKPLGNLGENQGFKNVWNSPNMQNFRQKAVAEEKDDPYFAPINCMKSCDNLGMNLQMHTKVMSLSPEQRERFMALYKAHGLNGSRHRLLPDKENALAEPFPEEEEIGHTPVAALQTNNSSRTLLEDADGKPFVNTGPQLRKRGNGARAGNGNGNGNGGNGQEAARASNGSNGSGHEETGTEDSQPASPEELIAHRFRD